MTIENQKDYIEYRIQKADESFADALLLAQNGRWNAVVNRLYYACFYAVIALLLSNDIKSTTHMGGRNQFSLHFIKTGKIDKRIGKHFSKLFDLRQKGDYGDLYDYDAVLVEPLIPLTKEFMEEIKRLIVT